MRGVFPVFGAMLAATASAGAGAAADAPPICADRPSKSTGECTVPKGNWQIESGLIDWSRTESDGVRTDAIFLGSSLIKYGVSDEADLELGVTPLATVDERSGSLHDSHSSFGDMLARVKYRLTRADAPLLVALDPFVKLPTANHPIGNGKVEAGLVVATSATLGKSGLTLSADPEIDLNADADGNGSHLATQQVVNLGIAASARLTLTAELWAKWDWDPAGTIRQASADASIAYLASNNLQLDAGANFGLNDATPDVELYTGVSIRF